jgi:hypothetical protein
MGQDSTEHVLYFLNRLLTSPAQKREVNEERPS